MVDKITGERRTEKKSIMIAPDSNEVVELAEHFSNNKALKSTDWFQYSDNSIVGRYRYDRTIFESF